MQDMKKEYLGNSKYMKTSKKKSINFVSEMIEKHKLMLKAKQRPKEKK